MLAVTLCLCLCVTSWSSIETAAWIEQVFWHRNFLPPVLHRVKKEIRVSLNSGISIVDLARVLDKMDAQNVISWTVVGQLSWQYVRAPTLDHCSLSQVIVKLYLQLDTVARVN